MQAEEGHLTLVRRDGAAARVISEVKELKHGVADLFLPIYLPLAVAGER